MCLVISLPSSFDSLMATFAALLISECDESFYIRLFGHILDDWHLLSRCGSRTSGGYTGGFVAFVERRFGCIKLVKELELAFSAILYLADKGNVNDVDGASGQNVTTTCR